ncbi:hypothetical protein MLD38_030810 [Melastoma candidum]|nr:hypothetical protein MLD38_030810 [Melastoma candidum]
MAQSHNLARYVRIPRRSVSFPSRLPFSQPIEIVSELKSLGASVSAAPPPCSKTVESNLRKLAEMYMGVGEIVTSLAGRKAKDAVEGAVDDVILLLDLCGHARDVVSSTKQEVWDLQSVLRRKSRSRGGEVEQQVRRFLIFRKNTRRATWKHLESLKRLERKNAALGPGFANTEDCEHSVTTVRESLRELHGTTVAILRLLLVSFTPSPKGNDRGWSLVSRIVLSRGAGRQRRGDSMGFSEAEGVEAVVQSLAKKPTTGREVGGLEDARRAQRVLEEMVDGCILGLEQGLDCLHMSLIRNRVCLLNLLAN